MTDRVRPIRRIVTGHDADCVSVFLSDGEATVERDGGDSASSFHKLWTTGAQTTIEADEPDPATATAPGRGLAPGAPGETLTRIVDMPPGVSSPMHRTETIDYGVLISGTLHLVLDQDETAVNPGDIIIQRGTDHRWENRSDEPARILFVLIAATFSPELRDQIDARSEG